MNPICDRPECQGPYRSNSYIPVGHENEDGSYTPHVFDETNHPSYVERARLRSEREFNERHEPDYIRDHGTTLYHGTTYERAKAISDHGFSLDDEVNGRHSGHGVYLTRSIREARSYGDHVVHCKVNTEGLHPNVFEDEDLHHIPTELLHHVMSRQGYTGHIDPDDKAHVIFNPKHVVPFAVQAPNDSPAMRQQGAKVDYANETPEEKALRRADFAKINADIPEVPNAPRASHTAFRGLYLGSSASDLDPHDPHQVMARVLDHTAHFRRMHDFPYDHPRQQLFGTHWTTDHDIARRFATRTVGNQDRGIPNYAVRPSPLQHHGVVFEARMHAPAQEESFYRGYGEKEVRIPSRDQIHTLIAHVHTLQPPAEDEDTHDYRRRVRDTHVHSFIVNDRNWRTAVRQIQARVKTPPGPNGEPTTGIMIAVAPPKRVVKNLPIPENGEHPDNIHITLAYLGDTSEHTGEQLGDLPELIEAWAETEARLEARVQGAGTFVNEGNHVLWASVDVPGMAQMHVRLVDYLNSHGFKVKDDHGFVPHLTLSYEKHHVRFLPKVEPTSWTVREVWCCIGGRWESFPLRGRA